MDRRTFLRGAASGLIALAARPAWGQEALDRATFIPKEFFPALPGKLVMLVQTFRKDSAEEYLQLSAEGSSWRDAYVPTTDSNSLHRMEFLVGPEGEKQVYPTILWASRTSTPAWAFKDRHALAEIEVPGGRGAPAGQKSFVITQARIVDGTAELPIRPAKAFEQVWEAHKVWLKKRDAEIEKALDRSREAVDRKKQFSRTIGGDFHLTWLNDAKRLRIRILTEIMDGSEYDAKLGGLQWGITTGRQVELDHTGTEVDVKELPAGIYRKFLPPAPADERRPLPVRDPLPPNPKK